MARFCLLKNWAVKKVTVYPFGWWNQLLMWIGPICLPVKLAFSPVQSNISSRPISFLILPSCFLHMFHHFPSVPQFSTQILPQFSAVFPTISQVFPSFPAMWGPCFDRNGRNGPRPLTAGHSRWRPRRCSWRPTGLGRWRSGTRRGIQRGVGWEGLEWFYDGFRMVCIKQRAKSSPFWKEWNWDALPGAHFKLPKNTRTLRSPEIPSDFCQRHSVRQYNYLTFMVNNGWLWLILAKNGICGIILDSYMCSVFTYQHDTISVKFYKHTHVYGIRIMTPIVWSQRCGKSPLNHGF